jgi:hypothetical protein
MPVKTFTGILLSLFCTQLCTAQAGWCIPRQSGDSTTLFINGWRTTVVKDHLLVTKGKARKVYYYTDTAAAQYYYYNRFIVRPERLIGTWQQADSSITFSPDSTYTLQPGDVQGRYEPQGNNIVLTAQQGQPNRFACWFEAAREGFILYLNNRNGTHYKLHKTTRP